MGSLGTCCSRILKEARYATGARNWLKIYEGAAFN
jgi:hypothetical protein